MRILHVLDAPYGGATISVLDLIRFSRDAETGFEHYGVYPGLGDSPDPRLLLFFDDCCQVPMRWWHIKPGLGRRERGRVWLREMTRTRLGLASQSALSRILHKWRIDLVHSNSSIVSAGAMAAQRHGLPHLWHIREAIGRSGMFKFPLDDAHLVARIAHRSKSVLAVSEYVAAPFRQYGQGPNVNVVADGVQVADFVGPAAVARGRRLRRLWGVADDELLVGTVGGLAHRVKRHDVIIRAAGILAGRFESVRFVSVGAMPKNFNHVPAAEVAYMRELDDLVRSQGLARRWIWQPLTVDNAAVMNAIDILAHACDVEAFGRVVVEAMAAGKPVVGPSQGGSAEVVVSDVTGLLVRSGDPAELASALERLARNPSLRAQMGRSGQDRARRLYSGDVYLAKIANCYHAALAGHRPSTSLGTLL